MSETKLGLKAVLRLAIIEIQEHQDDARARGCGGNQEFKMRGRLLNKLRTAVGDPNVGPSRYDRRGNLITTKEE